MDFTGHSHNQMVSMLRHCRARHYTYLSSSAVDLSWEEDPLFDMARNKLWCEHLVQKHVARALIVRPGFEKGGFEKGDRCILPERPAGCCAQNVPVPFFKTGAASLWNVEWPQTMVAVLAHYRGGSSCIAGVLHHLGVSMGETLAPPDYMNPRGYFECQRLHRLCHRFVDHPSLARRLPSPQMVGLLRQWAYDRSLANPQSQFLGAKHPALCCLGEELAAAWPRRRFVVVDRPADEIVASILRTDWGWNRDEATIAVATVHDQREQFLARCDPVEVLRVDFHQVLANPHQEIHRLAIHLGLPLARQSLATAAGHVVR